MASTLADVFPLIRSRIFLSCFDQTVAFIYVVPLFHTRIPFFFLQMTDALALFRYKCLWHTLKNPWLLFPVLFRAWGCCSGALLNTVHGGDGNEPPAASTNPALLLGLLEWMWDLLCLQFSLCCAGSISATRRGKMINCCGSFFFRWLLGEPSGSHLSASLCSTAQYLCVLLSVYWDKHLSLQLVSINPDSCLRKGVLGWESFYITVPVYMSDLSHLRYKRAMCFTARVAVHQTGVYLTFSSGLRIL